MKGKKRVLIVDDTKHFAVLLEEMINEQYDFEVVGKAYDGFQGLEEMMTLRPDIIILDIIMPNLDGLGVIEEITKRYQKGELIVKPKIIVLSAVGLDNIAKNALTLGADYCILKPFDFNAFMGRMRQISQDDKSDGEGDLHATEYRLTTLLENIGVPKHIKGFRYIFDAVMMVYQNQECINKMTSVIYPNIAEQYKTNAGNVERAMRNAVDLTLGKADENILNIFKSAEYSKSGRVSNTEFISILAERLKM